MSTFTHAQYEANELKLFNKEVEEVESQSLKDRKEAEKEVYEFMKNDPEGVGLFVSYLLDGNYGYGVHKVAMRDLFNNRKKLESNYVQLLMTLDKRCPYRHTVAAWRRLTQKEKAKLSKYVKKAIKEKRQAIELERKQDVKV